MPMVMKFTALGIIRSKNMSLMNPVWISVIGKNRTCSNCGEIINEIPAVYEFLDELDNGIKFKRTVVVPNYCKKCGEYFDYVLYLDVECPQ